MKNLLFTLVSIFGMTAAVFGSNITDGTLAIVVGESVVMNLENENQKSLIVSTDLNEEDENIGILFESKVTMIQVMNEDGELEMVLPVGSEDVTLGFSLFDKGNYKLGFLIEGSDAIEFTNLKVLR